MGPPGAPLGVASDPLSSFDVGSFGREDLVAENADPVSLYRNAAVFAEAVRVRGVKYAGFAGALMVVLGRTGLD
jgi:hypothetical protein